MNRTKWEELLSNFFSFSFLLRVKGPSEYFYSQSCVRREFASCVQWVRFLDYLTNLNEGYLRNGKSETSRPTAKRMKCTACNQTGSIELLACSLQFRVIEWLHWIYATSFTTGISISLWFEKIEIKYSLAALSQNMTNSIVFERFRVSELFPRIQIFLHFTSL